MHVVESKPERFVREPLASRLRRQPPSERQGVLDWSGRMDIDAEEAEQFVRHSIGDDQVGRVVAQTEASHPRVGKLSSSDGLGAPALPLHHLVIDGGEEVATICRSERTKT